ncbi:MAG: nucleotidyltransferase domain-containing protein [Candidatus Sumerlaeaceae bacterium]
MIPTDSRETISEMTRRLVAEFSPDRIILFGSRAWGEPSEDSDVDVLVIVEQSDESPIRRAQRAHHSLGSLRISVDILVKTRSEVMQLRRIPGSLVSRIFAEGKALYG